MGEYDWRLPTLLPLPGDHGSRSVRLLWGNKIVAGLGSHWAGVRASFCATKSFGGGGNGCEDELFSTASFRPGHDGAVFGRPPESAPPSTVQFLRLFAQVENCLTFRTEFNSPNGL